MNMEFRPAKRIVIEEANSFDKKETKGFGSDISYLDSSDALTAIELQSYKNTPLEASVELKEKKLTQLKLELKNMTQDWSPESDDSLGLLSTLDQNSEFYQKIKNSLPELKKKNSESRELFNRLNQEIAAIESDLAKIEKTFSVRGDLN